jgi:hypothetical protein
MRTDLLILIFFANIFICTSTFAYVLPYGNAVWNIPISGLPIDPNSSALANSIYNISSDRPNNFNIYKPMPIYDISTKTGDYPVVSTYGNMNGKTMPWGKTWQPGPATDSQVIVIDPVTGREWNLWNVSFNESVISASNANLVQMGVNSGDGSNPGNYLTKENGFIPSRGIGIQYMAMLVRPEEVKDGVIHHALATTIANTAGDKCVPPATKIEHSEHGPAIPVGTAIPEGTRFALNVTDAEITTWINSFPSDLPNRTTAQNTARIMAVALRDYGWFVSDSSGGGAMGFQIEGSGSAESQWVSLGFGDFSSSNGKIYPRDFFDGLFSPLKIYAIGTPNGTCPAANDLPPRY